MIWSLEEAIVFVNSLHDYLFPLGFAVALTGSILSKGGSDKDIDVIIYPLKKITANHQQLMDSLPKFGLTFVRLPNHNLGYQDDGKNVQVWKYKDKRVDLFFLS